jgi:hypothetical protein
MGFLFLRPETNRFGAALITVTVDDGGMSNNAVSRNFTVEVVHVNRPPFISQVSDQLLDEDTSSQAIPVTVDDPETPAANLSLIAFSSNPDLIDSSGISFGGNGLHRTVVLRPAPDRFGMATVFLTVFDPDGGSSSSTFTVLVNPVNDPPTLDALGNVTVYEGQGPKTLGLTGIGPGGIGETQFLTVSADTSSSSLITDIKVNYSSPDRTGTLVVTPAAHETGSVTVTVAVEDDGGTLNGGQVRSTRSFLFTVLPRPVLSIARDLSGVVLSWPASVTRFHLETTENLPSAEWKIVPNSPLVREGRLQVTLPSSGLHRYFRLHEDLPIANLSISSSSNTIVLSWPDSLVGYHLEATSGFSPGAWEPVLVLPILAGDQNTVTLEASETVKFFRLAETVNGP